MNRRTLLKWMGGSFALAGVPGLAFAGAPTDQRLVVVVLRGGLDALHAVPPYADADYQRLRPRLAVPPPKEDGGALDLDGTFGLHPDLAPLHSLYTAGELLVVHAATTSYRRRSHFDGQNQLENGSDRPFGARDGWLNRAVDALKQGDRRLGLALGPTVPVLLQGDAPVATWADSPLPKVDEAFLVQLEAIYADDPEFARTLKESRETGAPGEDAMVGRGERGRDLELAASAAADLLSRTDGPRLAVIESNGWDTHFGQERRLSALFKQLAAGLDTLRTGLGANWKHTAVVVVSEFGRTVAENGSQGTDHGVGGLALVLGGSVRGGRVVGEWPGLSEAGLYEGRDLAPANAYESVFKALLIDHMGISAQTVETRIFPDSAALEPFEGLFG